MLLTSGKHFCYKTNCQHLQKLLKVNSYDLMICPLYLQIDVYVRKGVSLNIHTAGIYEIHIFPQIMWIRLSGLTSAQMQESLKQSPGVFLWTQHSIRSKKRMSSRGRMLFLVSISKLHVSLETTGCRKCTREPGILCLEERMAQFRIIRLKEHFCHRL